MKLTKYAHACFTVEKDDQVLVVDPGNFSGDFIAPNHVVAVIITHKHPDHFDQEQLASIIDKNPAAVIIGPPAVCEQIETFQCRPVDAGDTLTIGGFMLEFFGGKHAIIHPSRPTDQNVGVMIDELLYYPGDSFAEPGRAVDTLALPAAAPWMKLSESMDFLTATKPRFAFPTHDAILSDVGQSMVDGTLGSIAEKQGTTYQRLADPIEV